MKWSCPIIAGLRLSPSTELFLIRIGKSNVFFVILNCMRQFANIDFKEMPDTDVDELKQGQKDIKLLPAKSWVNLRNGLLSSRIADSRMSWVFIGTLEKTENLWSRLFIF